MDATKILVQILLFMVINNYAQGDICEFRTLSDSPHCVAEIVCDGSINFNDVLRNWQCIRRRYYNNYYNDYDANKDYEIIMKIKNIKSGILEYHNITPRNMPSSKICEFELTNSTIRIVPTIIQEFENARNIRLSDNELEIINLYNFINKNKLNSINASNNYITILETNSDSGNEDLSIPSLGVSKVELIDLSFNSIQNIPNNYFSPFASMLHLNLSNNILSKFEILTFEGLTKLKTLYLSNNKLQDIGHTLVRFINLEELKLDNNEISVLMEPNFKTMVKLQKLNVSFNQISVIEDGAFDALIELSVLDLKNNNISILNKYHFKNNDHLEYLDLSHNNIKSIESSIFVGKNLTYFQINNNHLSIIIDNTTFSGISETHLDLRNNKIYALGESAFSSFESELLQLNLAHNSIMNITKNAFHNLLHLAELDMSYNNISDINFDLSILNDLIYLNISNNKLRKISKSSLQKLSSLIKLDLSFNTITEIENQAFIDLKKLEILIISNNLLTKPLSPYTFQGLTSVINFGLINTRTNCYNNNTFSGLSNLKTFNSSHGELEIIHHGAFNGTGLIEILDLSYNLLETFSIDVTSISEIKTLYLQNNRLTMISNNTFIGLNKLSILNIAVNNLLQIEAESFRSLSSLSVLDLSYNEELDLNGSIFDNATTIYQISLNNIKKSLKFEHITNVSINDMDLSSCNIISISLLYLYKIKHLSKLNLSSNKIKYVDKHSFQSMPHLLSLDLRFNLITSIQPGSFIHLNLLHDLNLHGNVLSTLRYGVFDGLKNLHTLNISSNSLHSFDANILHTCPAISIISLDDNLIEKIDVLDFTKGNIEELGIGGNILNCEDIVQWKTLELDRLKITAQTLDYHSENVDGFTCKTKENDQNFSLSNNTVMSNITAVFDSLANAMEIFRKTIESAVQNNVMNENTSTQTLQDVLNSINKLLKIFNESQTVSSMYLKQIIEKNGSTHVIVQDQVKSENNERDINTPIYVTLVCLIVLLVLFMYFIYNYFKWRNTKLEANSLSGNQQLTNDIELE